jgi:hypothetical protein
MRFLEFNEDVKRFVQGRDEASVLRDVHVQVHESSYLLRVLVPAGMLASLFADIARLAEPGGLAEIDPHRAKVALRWQERARVEPSLTYAVRSPRGAFAPLVISSASDLKREEKEGWVQVERYLVGEITDWGGAQTSNVHLRLRNTRNTVIIDAVPEQIRAQRENLVCHKAIVHVRAMEHPRTGQLKDFRLIELRAYEPAVSEERLQELFERGTRAWSEVPDGGAWVNEQRGGGYG